MIKIVKSPSMDRGLPHTEGLWSADGCLGRRDTFLCVQLLVDSQAQGYCLISMSQGQY